MTLDELRATCKDRVTRLLADAAPLAAQKMVELMDSDLDTVRFRAADRILSEFSERPQHGTFQGHGTNVQIINAIPFQRTAYDEKGKELEAVEIGNLRTSVPKYKSVSPATDEESRVRQAFAAGKRKHSKDLDVMSMKSIGPAVDDDPAKVPIP